MATFKISGTTLPSAQVRVYPFADDVIYGVTDAVGAYEIQWNAATSEEVTILAIDETNVVKVHAGVSPLEVV